MNSAATQDIFSLGNKELHVLQLVTALYHPIVKVRKLWNCKIIIKKNIHVLQTTGILIPSKLSFKFSMVWCC